jgi:hypothetical protein
MILTILVDHTFISVLTLYIVLYLFCTLYLLNRSILSTKRLCWCLCVTKCLCLCVCVFKKIGPPKKQTPATDEATTLINQINVPRLAMLLTEHPPIQKAWPPTPLFPRRAPALPATANIASTSTSSAPADISTPTFWRGCCSCVCALGASSSSFPSFPSSSSTLLPALSMMHHPSHTHTHAHARTCMHV